MTLLVLTMRFRERCRAAFFRDIDVEQKGEEALVRASRVAKIVVRSVLLSVFVSHDLKVLSILAMVELVVINPHSVCEATENGFENRAVAALQPAVG